MTSNEIRDKFLGFFESKGHRIVESAPLVLKDDPTLMFTNAGMNQFKDLFLGVRAPESPRVADTQKCLRVSGKHNDLEEVGTDTYHHTMFEMLGNWSFGDYFKKDAINWAWELLTEVYKIPADKLYVTVFEGSKEDGLAYDQEAEDLWKTYLPAERILPGNKKDNFWEMGETGPCGPCTEIHADLRNDQERKNTDGRTLVNTGHPEVIEIWNLVFMEYNRLANGSLAPLPAKHVDTGMGFERLCMVLQGKTSSYDTDIFRDYIKFLEDLSGIKYEAGASRSDIAMRVIADHIRAVSFAIADGQLPSSNGAGYVIRRILRRAVRYGYSFLDLKKPFFHALANRVADKTSHIFPGLTEQISLVSRVIEEEEISFLKTLEKGIQRFNEFIKTGPAEIPGSFAFELYDTYGFPVDLTQLMARENKLPVDMKGFEKELEEQKNRSRNATRTEGGDWITVQEGDETRFTGYDELEGKSRILRYREIKAKGKTSYQVIFDQTPFYAEGGGQAGDTGTIGWGNKTIRVSDTRRENNQIIHLIDKLPDDLSAEFTIVVDEEKRKLTERNHSATHLLHAALRKVLGSHVEQKGSLVTHDYLRFDFSHFSKMSDDELEEVERLVNEKIWNDIPREENRDIPLEEARAKGAMALFGEKYGDKVRMITFDPEYSVELCGGTHVPSTGSIGLFTIVSESAVAAGVRRIEAVTSREAYRRLRNAGEQLDALKDILKSKDPEKAVISLQSELEQLRKEKLKIVGMQISEEKKILSEIISKTTKSPAVIGYRTSLNDPEAARDLAFRLKNEKEDLILLLGGETGEKAFLSLLISDKLVKEKNLNAGVMIRELAKEIKGGGGGQPFFATAGGADKSGIAKAIEKFKTLIN